MQTKFVFLPFILFFTLMSIGYSQAERDWIIKISPVKILRGDLLTESLSLGLALEKKINNRWTVEQYVGYLTGTKYSFKNFYFFKRGIIVDKVKGIRLDSEIKYYFQKKKNSPYGVNIGGRSLFISTISTDDFYNNKGQPVTGEINRIMAATYVELGSQLVDRRFTASVDFYFGPQFISSNNSLDSTSYVGDDYGGKNYAFGSGFSFGYGLDFSIGFALK